MSASTQCIIAMRHTQRGTQTRKLSGWHTCRSNFPLTQHSLISCRFTTCLDSRKTGHRVQRSVFDKDVRQYGWGLPECLRPVEEGNQNPARRNEALLGPFVLDTLKRSGIKLAEEFLCKYRELSGQPGATRSMTPDRHLLGPYQQIAEKLSRMERLPQVHLNDLVREVRKEVEAIERHVKNMKSEWGKCFQKKNSGSTRNPMLIDLRRKFNSGPDAPHLSLLGDVPEIRASFAYKLHGTDNPTFAFSMAFEVLCVIKARALGGSIVDRELAELMAIPKVAVRTLSALRSQT
jgi:RNA-dependent RNA polymerase